MPDETADSASDTGTPASTSCPSPSVTLGTGIFAFEPLEEGQPLEMVYGDQGGWHFDTAAQVVGFGPDVAFKGVATVVRDGEVIGGANDDPVELDLTLPGLATWDAEGCTGSFYGQRTFLDDVEAGTLPLIQRMCGLDAEDVLFELEVTDLATGTVHRDAVTVFARLDPTTPCP